MWPACTRPPCVAFTTGIFVRRPMISASKDSRCALKWVMTTSAASSWSGIEANSCSRASTPPADAPTPTMKNLSSASDRASAVLT